MYRHYTAVKSGTLGTIGDPRKKARGAASGPGNVRASTVSYADVLVNHPPGLRGVRLYRHNKYKADWRNFCGAGNGDVLQGVWTSATDFVFLERYHQGCQKNSSFKPPISSPLSAG